MQLHQQFIQVAKLQGVKKIAIIDRSTDTTLTYQRALIAALMFAKKIAHYRDGFIGVMIPNSAGCILTVIGVLMAGKVPVMINYSTGAAENAEYAQKKCGFKTIITSRALVEKTGCRLVHGMVFVEDIRAGIGVQDKLLAVMRAKLPLGLLQKTVHTGEMDDNAVILFTSGSEKEPKAVQLTHRNLDANVKDISHTLQVRATDIILANLPLFHVFGHNVDFWMPIVNGLTLVTYVNPLDYRKICSIVREEKATLLVGTPAFFLGYLRQSEPGDFRSVRILVAGADKVPESLRDGFLEKHQLELCEGYGTTETSPVISSNFPGQHRPGSIGKPLPNVQVRIADILSGDPLPTGKQGKIMVKGELVMKGYFDDLEETMLRIKDGWYDTGDMGMLDADGYLWHLGRLRRFVKIGGEMVSLVKVETVLQELLGNDTECCVVEVPDSIKGARIVAVITAEVREKKLLRTLSEQLPAIAVPKQFIVFDELPKMGSGKVDFKQITELVRQKLNLNR